MEDNKKALDELLNVQIDSIDGFNMGDELMKNAANDILTLAKAQETITKTNNDSEKHELEMELLRKKDEREERESNARTKQGWFNVIGGALGALSGWILLGLLSESRAIDESNGDIMSRSQSDIFKATWDTAMRTIRRK